MIIINKIQKVDKMEGSIRLGWQRFLCEAGTRRLWHSAKPSPNTPYTTNHIGTSTTNSFPYMNHIIAHS